MTAYRRCYVAGGSWFFTVNLAQREKNDLLVRRVDLLREAFAYTQQRYPFRVDAVVILPEHLHCIWTLPPDDADYSLRWNVLKGYFSRALPTGEYRSASRVQRRERGIWQRRFWEHLLRDQRDFNQHVDYIHRNPLKHGQVSRVADWQYSSFHRYVEQGIYPLDWCGDDSLATVVGEVAIGVEKGSRPPLPPNRACGSPAHGSPVSGFLIGIGSLTCGLLSW